jgi:hypothetical protein
MLLRRRDFDLGTKEVRLQEDCQELMTAPNECRQPNRLPPGARLVRSPN